MTREVLEALGGIEKIVHPNETVFIKPNMVSLSGGANANPFVTGECTKPEIIIAVAEECLRAGASQVIIGDGSQAPIFDWKYATTLDKSTNLVIEAQRLSSKYKKEVKLACLETDSPGWVEVPVEGASQKIPRLCSNHFSPGAVRRGPGPTPSPPAHQGETALYDMAAVPADIPPHRFGGFPVTCVMDDHLAASGADGPCDGRADAP